MLGNKVWGLELCPRCQKIYGRCLNFAFLVTACCRSCQPSHNRSHEGSPMNIWYNNYRPTIQRDYYKKNKEKMLSQRRSPKKTLEEDLAWMYDSKSAFYEDRHRESRRTSGAGPRKQNSVRIIK